MADDHQRDRHPEGGPPATDEGVPAFDLPDWGTAGAPAFRPEAAPDAAPLPAGDTRSGPPVLVTVESVPGMRTVLGILAAEGRAAVEEDPAEAVGIARRAALDRLTEAATEAGADAVVGVRFELAVTKRTATVLAAGTGVAFGRD